MNIQEFASMIQTCTKEEVTQRIRALTPEQRKQLVTDLLGNTKTKLRDVFAQIQEVAVEQFMPTHQQSKDEAAVAIQNAMRK